MSEARGSEDLAFLKLGHLAIGVRPNRQITRLPNGQVAKVIPLGKHQLHEHLGDVEQLLEDGNADAALATIKMLRERISGDEANPLTA